MDMQKVDLNVSARGEIESPDMSMRSDAKLFGNEMMNNNERFKRANGKITEVEENDLELEGGANDIPQFEKN
jgi:hypothetical protein